MNLPLAGDFIDIHTHGSHPAHGKFMVEILMAHEAILPEEQKGIAYAAGIHPWHLNEGNRSRLTEFMYRVAPHPAIVAVGEAGFDRLRGPSIELQREVFEEQVRLAGQLGKPMVIHCVKAWDEILAVHRRLKPTTLWLIHGFRGKKELATQLISRGFYISIWFEFALRPESADLIRFLPVEKLFLETDGADIDIRDIYIKVAADLGFSMDELKTVMNNNFKRFLGIDTR
jgi:TatD DNase family protein